MKHFHDEVRIEAPLEHVWQFFCDTSHWKDFMPQGEFDFSGPVDEVGTTYVTTMKLMGYEIKRTFEIVEVEPLRLVHEHTDSGPMDNYMRFESDGGATNFIVDTDYEMSGKLPGFIKDMLSKGWGERAMRNVLRDFKALAEAEVPAEA